MCVIYSGSSTVKEDVGDADLSAMSMEYEENEVEESAEIELDMEEGDKDAECKDVWVTFG